MHIIHAKHTVDLHLEGKRLSVAPHLHLNLYLHLHLHMHMHLHVTCTFNYTCRHTFTCTINNLRWTETGDSCENQRTCWGPSRYSVRAQGLKIRRTCLGIEILRTCTAPVRESSYELKDSRCLYEPEDTRDIVRVRWYLEPLETQTSKKPLHQGSTVIPEPLAWHILPSDANPREQPTGEKTLNLT